MIWISPSEKSVASDTMKTNRLLAAANQLFGANRDRRAAQYSQPVLGLTFRRFVEVRFSKQRAQLESPSPLSGERAGVRSETHSGDATRELSIHGVEKTGETGRLYHMNLAVPAAF